MKKPKVLIFFENDFTLRSYLETPVLDLLKADYSIEGVLTFDLGTSNRSLNNSMVWHNIDKNPLLQVLQTIVAIEYWFKNQIKSNSYRIRILSLRESRRVFYSSRNNREFPSLSIFLGFLFAKVSLRIPSSFLWLIARSYRRLLVECAPNVVICVTSGGATSNSDILAIAGEKFGFPVLTITENWDNLTSKAVFSRLPDYLGVWGASDKAAAVKLHGFAPEKIILLGSPRVSQLFQNQLRNKKVSLHMLFAGGSIDIEDDLTWFNQVHGFAKLQGIGLVYVPHPSNYNRLAEIITSGNEQITTHIPAQILGLITQRGKKRYPKLKFYDDLLSNSFLVISPFSTLLLESLLIDIPAIGLDFQDPKNSGLGWASERFEHLVGLDYFQDYIRVRTETELTNALILRVGAADKVIGREPINALDSRNSPFYDFSETFSVKLIGALRKILSGTSNR